jgi:hypothetical protein
MIILAAVQKNLADNRPVFGSGSHTSQQVFGHVLPKWRVAGRHSPGGSQETELFQNNAQTCIMWAHPMRIIFAIGNKEAPNSI